jgi:hypothetical protein
MIKRSERRLYASQSAFQISASPHFLSSLNHQPSTLMTAGKIDNTGNRARSDGHFPMPNIPGLRSCYAKVGRLIYFGRMLDKIRLHAAGKLPPEYHHFLGERDSPTLDGRCCRFLGVGYSEIKRRALAGETDESILNWAHAHGTPRTDEECHVWNRFIAKLGWRDERSHVLPQRIQESGLTGKPIETLIDHIEFDEGRDPVAERAWEKI